MARDLIRAFAAMLLLAPLLADAGYPEGLAALRKGDVTLATSEFTQGARSGDAKAQYTLGMLSSIGVGVPLNREEAAAWFTKAAAQGHSRAQYNIGLLHLFGIGVARNGGEAERWLLLAANGGLAQAQSDLGYLYFLGEFLKRDYPQAVAWFRKAAEQGHPFGQTNLACAHLTGGVTRYVGGEGGPITSTPWVAGSLYPPDEKEAARWFRMAAEQGHLIAQFNTGLLNDRGRGVERNASEAVKWYEKAVAADFSPAFINLAVLYGGGAGGAPAPGVSTQLRMKSSARGLHRAHDDPIVFLQFGVESALNEAEVFVGGRGERGDVKSRMRPGLIVDPDLNMPLSPAPRAGNTRPDLG